MSWKLVARWIKAKDNEAEIRQVIERTKRHWESVALDVGFDPTKNVEVQENDKEARVYISQEMDETFRDEPGSWR